MIVQVTPLTDERCVVLVDNARARRLPGQSCRSVYVTARVVVKIGEPEQNRKEAHALRSIKVRRAARRWDVILPRLLAVSPTFAWIAMERLALRRPGLIEARRHGRWSPAHEARYRRVERVMRAAGRDDYDVEYWNWALVDGRPAVYDLGV